MAKIILLCGKICSGKSTYAEKIRREMPAAVLSADEIMLAIFGHDAGERHDIYVEAVKKYLFEKSVQLVGSGINVIMDIGLWTRAERIKVREFYRLRSIPAEIRYIDISDDEWRRRIDKRNREVSEKLVSAYYIDGGLAEKAARLFEAPEESEIDLRIG
ncbi:MAG: ATP-binding protein [Alistipes sp.]|nr:ATP-binding protein [Alistipes sp.]